MADSAESSGGGELPIEIKASGQTDLSTEELRGSLQSYLKDYPNAESVALRGSWTSGQHQEIFIRCGGRNIRISRNNSSDTFQLFALQANPNTGSELQELDREGMDKAAQEVYQAFLEAHTEIPRYEQGDCHAFAKNIFCRLTGRSPGSAEQQKVDEFEEGFM